MNATEEVPLRFAGLPRHRYGDLMLPVATNIWARLLGLTLLSRPKAGPGLLIPSCRSVHSFGMRFPLRIVFLDVLGRPIRTVERMPPWRIHSCAEADAVVELTLETSDETSS